MRLLLLALFVSLVVFLMTISIYLFYITPVSEFSYYTNAFVTKDTAGFDVNSTAITFGSVVIGGSSTRSILVNNSYPFPVRVEPKIEGSIKEIISFEPLVVGPYQEKKFYLTVYADSPELLGNYTGNIDLRLMRVIQ